MTPQTLFSSAAAAAAGLLLLLGNATPAGADSSPRTVSANTSVTADSGVVAQPAAASYSYSCFGHFGTFLDNGYDTVLDFSGEGNYPTWPDGSRGCYGIAPDRTIWQINSTASKWFVIPGNGRADYMYGATQNSSGSQKTIIVGVGNPANYDLYSDTYIVGSGWQGWHQY